MRLWIRNVSFLLVIGSVLGVLGLFSGDLYRLLSLLSFLIFISTFLPGLKSPRGLRWFDTHYDTLAYLEGQVRPANQNGEAAM